MIVKFHVTPVYPYGNDHYYHEIIALAEGFSALGFEVVGNCDYWWQPEKKEFLIKEGRSIKPKLNIYDYRFATSFEHLLFREGFPNFESDELHVLVDRNDWVSPIWWKKSQYAIYDLILAGNLYQTITYPKNVFPWAIGLTNRIIQAIDTAEDQQQRNPAVGYNFRVEHNMRGYLLNQLKLNLKKYPLESAFTQPEGLSEIDQSYYSQSTSRHNPAYYQSLKDSAAFLAFGGYYDFLPVKYQPYNTLDKILRKPAYFRYQSKKKNGKDFSDEIFIFQQDNFRFWEVLYAGSSAINLDLDYWSFLLPVMPKSGEHYIGVKKLTASQQDDLLGTFDNDDLMAIGKQGKQWVLEHYSPKAQANRVLTYLKKIGKNV